MELFKGQHLLEFNEQFKTDTHCKEYLPNIKWDGVFECVKCGHSTSQVSKNFSRTCNKYSHTDTAIANTLFHKVKFGIRKAFFICFEMSMTTKNLSASYMGIRYGLSEKTARLFMHKVRGVMKSSENHPMDGGIHVDEFVVGGIEKNKVGRSYHSKKKKVVCAVKLTGKGKIRRMDALKIDNFSAKEIEKIFEKHIDEQAKVTTDLWKDYRPLSKQCNITQIESNNGLNFKALHTLIHRVKSWLRTTYSWLSDFNISHYLMSFIIELIVHKARKAYTITQ